ncbi:hypothetical protein PVAG01_02195 [Phlyctema vagabunda]|uniref:Uncharacterized protein n=1 Tax=Phlyctema vagabunda TaxID=108571 RepID=A0ABR4PPZ5_9HELO
MADSRPPRKDKAKDKGHQAPRPERDLAHSTRAIVTQESHSRDYNTRSTPQGAAADQPHTIKHINPWEIQHQIHLHQIQYGSNAASSRMIDQALNSYPASQEEPRTQSSSNCTDNKACQGHSKYYKVEHKGQGLQWNGSVGDAHAEYEEISGEGKFQGNGGLKNLSNTDTKAFELVGKFMELMKGSD